MVMQRTHSEHLAPKLSNRQDLDRDAHQLDSEQETERNQQEQPSSCNTQADQKPSQEMGSTVTHEDLRRVGIVPEKSRTQPETDARRRPDFGRTDQRKKGKAQETDGRCPGGEPIDVYKRQGMSSNLET